MCATAPPLCRNTAGPLPGLRDLIAPSRSSTFAQTSAGSNAQRVNPGKLWVNCGDSAPKQEKTGAGTGALNLFPNHFRLDRRFGRR
jgi:hypothetical protein